MTFQNQSSSVLWLKWTQTMEMKQNQTYFNATYLNLTQSTKVFQWLSILLQKWAQTSKVKSN